MATIFYQPGNKVRYLHYGAVMRGKVVRLVAGNDQLIITRLDGPLAGSQTWIHVNSVLHGD
jgi:hypothetical protein